jgi:hypothetical protein
MKRQLLLYVLTAALAILPGCASNKVLVPPRVDLGIYNTLGIIVFTSNETGNLGEYATQQFMAAVQAAQSGVRILELGSAPRVLGAVEHDELDFEAMRAIGQRWGVDAVFAGHLELEPVKPNLKLTTVVKSMSLRAEVEALLHARLVETASGATVWTSGAKGKAPVAHVSLISRGPLDLGATDPESAYGELVQALTGRATVDFYAHWKRQ